MASPHPLSTDFLRGEPACRLVALGFLLFETNVDQVVSSANYINPNPSVGVFIFCTKSLLEFSSIKRTDLYNSYTHNFYF